MKTPVIQNHYDKCYKTPQDTKIIYPESETNFKGYRMGTDGTFQKGSARNLYIYRIPACVAAYYIEINTEDTNFLESNYGIEKGQRKEDDEQRLILSYFRNDLFEKNNEKAENLSALGIGQLKLSEKDRLQKWFPIPRILFSSDKDTIDINDYIYLVISCIEEPVVHVHHFPENQPFFWEKSVATSLNSGERLRDSNISLGVVMTIIPKKNDNTRGMQYREIVHSGIFVWKRSNQVVNCVKGHICSVRDYLVVFKDKETNSVLHYKQEVYVYSTNRHGHGNDVTAFVWHSGNEDDIVKKEYLGYKENDPKIYTTYPFIMDSLSLGIVYHSYASLSFSLKKVAHYVTKYIACQPKGYRSLSIEGHLAYLMGGALSRIANIVKGMKSDKKEYSSDVLKLIQAYYNQNDSFLFFDCKLDYKRGGGYKHEITGVDSVDKDEEARKYLRDVLRIQSGQSACERMKELLLGIFTEIKKQNLSIDYVYCDIEDLFNEARNILVRRFDEKYLKALAKYNNNEQGWEDYKIRIYEAIYNEIYMSNKTSCSKDALIISEDLDCLGYYHNLQQDLPLEDIQSVRSDEEPSLYGNKKVYEKRRNLNVWDVVMKNYTNKLFYNYVYTPILQLFPKTRFSVNSRFMACGYHNRAEMFETYLGGSLKLDGQQKAEREMYSSIPLYGEHMTSGYKKLNMDNWKVFPKVTPYSFFIDHINRLRLVALSSKGKFDVFLTSWNIWAYDINQILHFHKNVVKSQKKNGRDRRQQLKITENLVKGYYCELLYHTFLLNPDKAIAYFNLEESRRHEDYYIALEKNRYFKESYKSLQKVLDDINTLFDGGEIKPLTNVLATETDPFVITGAEVNGKNIWRLSYDSAYECKHPSKALSKVATFSVADKTITFKSSSLNGIIVIHKGNSTCGFWIITPKNVMPQISSQENYYYHHPAYYKKWSTQGVIPEGDEVIDFGDNARIFSYKDFNNYTLFGELPLVMNMSLKFEVKGNICSDNWLLWSSEFEHDGKKFHVELGGENKTLFVILGGDCQLTNSSIPTKCVIQHNEKYELKLQIKFSKEEDGTFSNLGTAIYSLCDSKDNVVAENSSSIYLPKIKTLQHFITTMSICHFRKEEVWNNFYLEDFRLYFSGHHEKVELFRESNGLNITRVNKNVAAYANSKIEADFTDRIIAKFSWLNAEQRSIMYRLPFVLEGIELPLSNVIRPSSDIHKRLKYPQDGRMTIHKVTDSQIILEVAPNSEGYMLFQITKNPVTITDATCVPEEIIDDVNPDAIYHVM